MEDKANDVEPTTRRGRPRRPATDLRHNRVVTFLTASELQRLKHIAEDEDRSLSSVVHRIIDAFLNQQARESEQ